MESFYHDSSRKTEFDRRARCLGPLSGPERCQVDVLEWSPGRKRHLISDNNPVRSAGLHVDRSLLNIRSASHDSADDRNQRSSPSMVDASSSPHHVPHRDPESLAAADNRRSVALLL